MVKCKYCGIGKSWSNYKSHTHCKQAYNRGEMMQMFSPEEVEEIRKVIKKLKPFVK